MSSREIILLSEADGKAVLIFKDCRLPGNQITQPSQVNAAFQDREHTWQDRQNISGLLKPKHLNQQEISKPRQSGTQIVQDQMISYLYVFTRK